MFCNLSIDHKGHISCRAKGGLPGVKEYQFLDPCQSLAVSMGLLKSVPALLLVQIWVALCGVFRLRSGYSITSAAIPAPLSDLNPFLPTPVHSLPQSILPCLTAAHWCAYPCQWVPVLGTSPLVKAHRWSHWHSIGFHMATTGFTAHLYAHPASGNQHRIGLHVCI